MARSRGAAGALAMLGVLALIAAVLLVQAWQGWCPSNLREPMPKSSTLASAQRVFSQRLSLLVAMPAQRCSRQKNCSRRWMRRGAGAAARATAGGQPARSERHRGSHWKCRRGQHGGGAGAFSTT
jgi:hypothetical protein